MKNFYFKKGVFGMKLMVERRRPSDFGIGNWELFWSRASEVEAQKLYNEFMSMRKDKVLIEELKNKNPELFI